MALPAPRTKIDVLAAPTVKAVPIVDRPRDPEFAWLRQHGRDYAGQWVALDGSRLLGAAYQLKELLQRITPAERGRHPLFHRVDAD